MRRDPRGMNLGDSERFSAVDRTWLRMEHPTNLMMINGVLFFDEPLELERLRAVIAERLVPIKRFRQRVAAPTGWGGRACWETDPELDLDAHVERVRLPSPGDDGALQKTVSRLMSTPLDYTRPLWQFHVIDNYQGGGALMGRLHHCIGDGIALMMVLLALTDLDPGTGDEALGPEAGASNPLLGLFDGASLASGAARDMAARVLPGAMGLLTQGAEALRSANRWLLAAVAGPTVAKMALRLPDPKTVFKGPLGVEKLVAWSRPIPCASLSASRGALGVTMNDMLLSAVAGSLRGYLVERGQRVDGLSFRAAVPVNLRPLEEMSCLGNRFGLVFLSLPVGIADPRARLAELRRRMQALRRSAEPVVSFGVLKTLGLIPGMLQDLVVKMFATKITAVMTNVPGPSEPLYLAGRKLTGIMFWVPQSGRVGMGISIMSYLDHVRVGVVTDGGLVPDPEAIVEGLHRELDELARLAGSNPD